MFEWIRTRRAGRDGASRRLLRLFLHRQDGAAMVEFGLVAAPFLALIFAILETAVVFFAGQVLETYTADSARLIMTGQAQSAGYTASAFKDKVCTTINTYGVFDCSKLKVDVQTFTSFANISLDTPVNNDGTFKDTQYNAGKAGDIVVVRLMYQWPVYVSLLGFNLSNLSNGYRLLIATAAFRNEPYQ